MAMTALAVGDPDDHDPRQPQPEPDGEDSLSAGLRAAVLGIAADSEDAGQDRQPREVEELLSAEHEAEVIGEAADQLAAHIWALIEYLGRLKSEQRGWKKGAAAERRLRSMLGRLDPSAWWTFGDLQWPGTRGANIDLLVVGPPGVFVVDVKNWSDATTTRERVDDAATKVRDQAAAVRLVLSERGLAPGMITPLLVFDGPGRRRPTSVKGVEILSAQSLLERLTELGPRLDPSRVHVLATLIEAAIPKWSDLGRARSTSESSQLELLDEALIRRELAAVAERGPIEDWMVWLDPSQAALVMRNFTGPARIRGASGTGKTVVALHRAHYLAEQLDHRVLFTSYVRSLVRVEDELFQRLGRPRLGSVEFRSVFSWALALLRGRGIEVEIDDKSSDRSFVKAWQEVGRSLSIAELGVPLEYWREEIKSVIKGRGLTNLDGYMQLERVGRSVPLQPTHRRDMWRLFESYERYLRATGFVDWPDVINLANDELGREPLARPYDSVVVDEVQDLSVSALRLLTKVVNPEEPRILLVGDGQQSIYTGSFRLSEAGLDVTGRGTVLKINYRNGRGILDRAMEIVQNLAYSDLDSDLTSARRKVRAIRPGGTVVEVAESRSSALERRLLSDLRSLLSSGFRPGDCAVLCYTNHDADRWRSVLQRSGLRCLGLEDYKGRAVPAIKVGTYCRAKGLEFAAVFIPDLHDVVRARRPNESEEAAEERATSEARQLFVACTRARDYLWLGRLSPGA